MTKNTGGSVSRRRFLKTSAALAAASAAATAKESASERINVGVIGCRNRGWEDSRNFLGTGKFDIVSLCDCDTAMIDVAMGKLDGKLRQKPKFEQDFRKVLDDKNVDAIINTTPDHWHALIAIAALEAGKHVYLEKPASYNIDEGKAMVAAVKKHPMQVVAVGTQQRSGQHFKDAKQFIASGGLGKVGFCRGWITHIRPVLAKVPDTDPPSTMDWDMFVGPAPWRPYNENRAHYNWHWTRDMGTGEMENWGAHWLDVIRYLMDLDVPTSASAVGQKIVNDIKEWPDTQTVLYQFGELAVLWEQRLWTGFTVNGMSSGAEFGGDAGSLVINRSGWVFYPNGGKPEKHPGSELEGPHAQNFADCIAGKAKPSASIEEGVKSAIVCHLGNITATLNRRVEFDPATQNIVNDAQAMACQTREYRKPWQLSV